VPLGDRRVTGRPGTGARGVTAPVTLAHVARGEPVGEPGAGGWIVIFKSVREGRPYPDHGTTLKQWSEIPPRPVRLDQLIATKLEMALDRVLAEDSTFYGDLFPHVVQWEGDLYLEDGLHRALRAALQQRMQIHVRVLVLS